jgi:hypothetical protein
VTAGEHQRDRQRCDRYDAGRDRYASRDARSEVAALLALAPVLGVATLAQPARE